MPRPGDLGLVLPLWTLAGLLMLRTEVQTLTSCLLLICRHQVIKSAVGDDVILPCHVAPRLNVENMTVKWWKLDPTINYRYVHRYQDHRDKEHITQMPTYARWMSMFPAGLKHGSISLKIRNVALSDGGIYRCGVPQLRRASIIELVVKPCTTCDRDHGLFAKRGCTATTDRVCDVISGYFCKALMDDTGCSLAQKHAHCGPGHRTKEPGTSRTDTVCESCPPGYFSLDGVNCTVWTTCSEAQVMFEGGSGSSDVVCGAPRQRYPYIALILPYLTVVGLVIKGKLSSKKTRGHHALCQIAPRQLWVKQLERRPSRSGVPRPHIGE